MSSKSRKQSDKTRKARNPAAQSPGAPAGAGAAAQPDESLFEISDEILHAPKETSKLRFALMIGLVVFLLIIFSIPGALLGGAGKTSQDDPIRMTLDVPGKGLSVFTAGEFQQSHRALADAMEVDPMMKFSLGVTANQPSPEDAARILAINELALGAGIEITEKDLVAHLEFIRDIWYGKDGNALKAAIQRRGSNVESNIVLGLRVQRFLQLLGFAGAVPSPEAIEKSWHDEHAEVRFEYVVAEAADFEDAARAELPADEELEAWFDEKPDWERSALNNPERRGVQVARFQGLLETPAAALVAAFPPAPPAEGEVAPSAEELAEEYYNKVFTRRFRVEEEGEEGEATTTRFLSLEETQEQCLAEAPIEAAMQRWLLDLQRRQGEGEEIDFLAEATQYGLDFIDVELGTRDDFLDHESLSDATVLEAIFVTPVDAFAYTVAVTAETLGVVRITEQEEATLPPFEEIRDEVAELWIEPRSLELATESLEALRASFEAFTPEPDENALALGAEPVEKRRADEAAFLTAVEEAGLTLATRDWADRGAKVRAPSPTESDPDGPFFQRNKQLSRMEEGEVGEPLPGTSRTSVYLVRLAGEREIPIERMSPGDYARYKQTLVRSGANAISAAMDLEYLKSQFGLDLPGWEEDAEEPVEEEPDVAAEEEAGAALTEASSAPAGE